MALQKEYQYPVTNVIQALSVLKPFFDVTKHRNLYVDFSSVRAVQTSGSLKLKLGIVNDSYDPSGNVVKILYTGHQGCGKTVELTKLQKYLNDQDRYFAVFTDLQDNFQPSSFEPEDLFVLLITSLVQALESQGINFNVSGLNKLAEDWLSDDPEIEKEIENSGTIEGGAEAEAGFNFWKLLSMKVKLNTIFSYKSKTSTTIRRKVKENQGEYVIILNQALLEIKHRIADVGKGKEIIFIIDGIERFRQERYDTYIRTFFRDARLIQDLNCSMICCVPIDSLYDIHTIGMSEGLYEKFTLPMVAVNKTSLPLFCEVIGKRINEDAFFEPGVIEYCVEQSGGNLRQLFRIISTALSYSEPNNFIINKVIAEKACSELGLALRRTLTAEHFRLLKERKYHDDADKNILDMLFSLAIMEYNGDLNQRLPNPLLKPYLADANI